MLTRFNITCNIAVAVPTNESGRETAATFTLLAQVSEAKTSLASWM